MNYESQEHYEAEMGYAGQAEAEALAQEAEQYPEPTLVATDKYMTTNLDTSFRYICRDCKFGFEGNCEGCYLLNEQVKNQ